MGPRSKVASSKPLVAAFILLVTALFASLPAAAANPPDDSLPAARFELSIDGHSLASFSELAGISSVVEVIPSGPPLNVFTVVLRRPMTRNIELAAWHELVILGDVAAARKSCSLTMFNTKGDPVARYHLTDAWPMKVEITTVKVGGSDVLMETVTFTGMFIQRISV